MNSGNVGGKTFVSCTGFTMCKVALLSASRTKIVLELLLVGLLCSINSTGNSSARGALSTFSVGSQDRASTAWCLIPARCTKSKSSLDRRRRHQAS